MGHADKVEKQGGRVTDPDVEENKGCNVHEDAGELKICASSKVG